MVEKVEFQTGVAEFGPFAHYATDAALHVIPNTGSVTVEVVGTLADGVTETVNQVDESPFTTYGPHILRIALMKNVRVTAVGDAQFALSRFE